MCGAGLAGKLVSTLGRRFALMQAQMQQEAGGEAEAAHADGHRKASALVFDGVPNLQQQPGPSAAEGPGARRGQLHLQEMHTMRLSCTLQD